jgi:osmotically-inducible protein OsmY
MTTVEVTDKKDAQLEEEIERILWDGDRSFKILAIAKKGYVNLCGYVENLHLKKDIESMVEAVPGVRIVTNHVHVRRLDERRNQAHF